MQDVDRLLKYVAPEPNTGCWLWLGGDNGYGYGRFYFRKRFWGAHRVAWTLMVGEIPKGLCVLHKCDVRGCVNPDHLWLGTYQDNSSDAVQKQRIHRAVGEANPAAKLTRQQVDEMRTLKGLSQRRLANMYAISQRAVGMILRREMWA